MNILVVEDEPKLNQSIVLGLRNRGYVVDGALDGQEGERKAIVGKYDLLILDIMMPKQDGMMLCRRLRERGMGTPVLFLTARDSIDDRVVGLDTGADDYLVKPFSFEELSARVRSLLRRGPSLTISMLELAGLKVDIRSQTVSVEGKELELTAREYALLVYLIRHKGEVVTREDLLSKVWDEFSDTLSNVVDVHLKNLRKKLPKSYARRIKTVWGKGYRLA
ncbi:response regulator transcription factor [Candidatus Uhrbacteria bacterium]|nr:response regulator transcription factor [Candidatus Uhrbacteria bacterium]